MNSFMALFEFYTVHIHQLVGYRYQTALNKQQQLPVDDLCIEYLSDGCSNCCHGRLLICYQTFMSGNLLCLLCTCSLLDPLSLSDQLIYQQIYQSMV